MFADSPLIFAFVDLSVLGFAIAAIAMLVKQRKVFGSAISPVGLVCAGTGIGIFGLYYLTDLLLVAASPWGHTESIVSNIIKYRSDVSWMTNSYGLILLFASLLLAFRHIFSRRGESTDERSAPES